MSHSTDPAIVTATRLAAELIIRRDELTARQIGIIATALELPESDPLEVVEDGPPCPAKDGGYLCTLPEGHAGDHAAEGVEGQPPLHTWRGMSPLPGLATMQGAR